MTTKDLYEAIQELEKELTEANPEAVQAMPLVEEVIFNFLTKCKEDKTLPTLKEAEVLTLLDNIVYKYI